MCSNYPGIKLEPALGTQEDMIEHLSSYAHVVYTIAKNRSFHVVERTRTSTKCQKMKNARAKRAKILFSIVKYANLRSFCCCRRRGCLSSLIFIQCYASRFSVLYIECPSTSPDTVCDWTTK